MWNLLILYIKNWTLTLNIFKPFKQTNKQGECIGYQFILFSFNSSIFLGAHEDCHKISFMFSKNS